MYHQQIQEYLTAVGLEGLATQVAEKDEMLAGQSLDYYLHYFRVTKSAIDIIKGATERLNQEVDSILDMPSGHGRVSRGLRWLFPTQTIVACDVNTDGVNFCAENFNCLPVDSSDNFNEVKFPTQFDLIWCGSLITHLPEERGLELLNLLVNNLTDQGILILTNHGDTIVKFIINQHRSYGIKQNKLYDMVNNYYRLGYGYCDFENFEGYGISLIDKTWFEKSQSKIGLKLLDYQEAVWDNHHDVALIKKS